MRETFIKPLADGVARRKSVVGDWRIVEYDRVGSTNFVAAKLRRGMRCVP